MATTDNMGLTQPGPNDLADIDVINANMAKLDGHRHLGGIDGLAVRAVQAGVHTNRPSPGTLGQVWVESDDGGAFHFDNGSAWVPVLKSGQAGMERIAEQVLSSAAATISFTSIPQTFSSLQIELVARGDASVTDSSMGVQFNGDTGSNYDWCWFWGQHGASPNLDTYAGSPWTSVGIPDCACASSPSNQPSYLRVFLPNYAGTTFRKVFQGTGYLKYADPGGQRMIYSAGTWRNTAAITSVSMFLGAGNFATGTVATLYGLL